MNDTIKVLVTHPEIGLTTTLGSGFIHFLGVLNPILSFVSLAIGISTTVGSGVVHWLGILNPILSFISLIIALIIGLLTLYGKIKEIRGKNE